jgi:hypothetical protein
MFCNRCGTELPDGSAACANCGRSIGDPVRAIAQSRLQHHLRTLGVLWMVIGGLFAIPAAGLMIFGRGIHMIIRSRNVGPHLVPLVLYTVGGTMVVLAAGGICVGLGLMQQRPWARTTAIILAVLALFHPPFGTALGVYTLWVLLADEDGEEYQYLSRAA